EPWDVFFGDVAKGRPGGLRTMTMEHGPRADGRQGYSRISVEALEAGVGDTRLTFNDHFDIATLDKPATAATAVKLIEQCWDASFARGKAVTQALMDLSDA